LSEEMPTVEARSSIDDALRIEKLHFIGAANASQMTIDSMTIKRDNNSQISINNCEEKPVTQVPPSAGDSGTVTQKKKRKSVIPHSISLS